MINYSLLSTKVLFEELNKYESFYAFYLLKSKYGSLSSKREASSLAIQQLYEINKIRKALQIKPFPHKTHVILNKKCLYVIKFYDY